MKKKIKKKNLEIRFYEGILKTSPNFTRVLSFLGDAYTCKGFYKEGLEIDKKLAKLKPKDPTVYYNLACSFSLLEKTEQALEILEKAILLGYEDIDYILADPDLENARGDVHFDAFFSKFKKVKI